MKKVILFFIYLLSLNCNATSLADLGYKSVFRTFYPAMFNAQIEDSDYKGHDLPKVGIKNNGKKYLAFMHPVQNYKNSLGEDRYLLFIEKREIENVEYEVVNGKRVKVPDIFYNFSNTCHACYAEADLRIFKKNSDNKFELISSTQNGYKSENGYGVADLDISDLKSKLKKVGEARVGFFHMSSDFNHGLETTTLNLIVLDENQIKDFFIDIVGSDDRGKYIEETPLSHTLKGFYRLKDDYLINGYYPIEIKFEGDKYDLESEEIINYNNIDTYEFSLKENKFKLTSSKAY